MPEYVADDIEICSDSDIEDSDEENFNEKNYDEEISMKKTKKKNIF